MRCVKREADDGCYSFFSGSGVGSEQLVVACAVCCGEHVVEE